MKTLSMVTITIFLFLWSNSVYPQDSTAKKQLVPPPNYSEFEKAPSVKTRVFPKYPKLALKAAIEGNVYTRLWVNEQGNVEKVKILSSDREIFESAAEEAAYQWKFYPAEHEGKPIAVWVTIPFKFKLPTKDEDRTEEFNTFIETFKSTAMDIIRGRNLDISKQSVSPEAYVIDGNHYESLWAVLNGEKKECKIVEGMKSQFVLEHLNITEKNNAAFLILKTVSGTNNKERYHSIVFFRMPAGDWKIVSWHVSG